MSWGCGGKARPNVIIVTVDGLRRDVMRTYAASFPFAATQQIDGFAARSVVLENGYVSCPQATQSVASLMTGLYAPRHGAYGLLHRLDEQMTTLAEIYREEGYRTAAVVTNYFLRGGRGFEQGFESYDDMLAATAREGGAQVFDRVQLALREGRKAPFLIWIDYSDPSWPYAPPAQILKSLHREYDRPFTLYQDINEGKITRGAVIFHNSLDSLDRRHLQRRYLGEVVHIDTEFGRLVSMLESRGLLKNTILLFCASHGESLGEHDYFYAHGATLYNSSVHVPAFIFDGRNPSPGRVRGICLNVDFLPTLLELSDLAVPGDLDGVSFAAALRDGGATPRPVAYFESEYQAIHPENPWFRLPGPAGKWRAILAPPYKLIGIPGPDGADWELYNVDSDHTERTNLVATRVDVAERLLSGLRDWEALVDQETAQSEELDEETRARLRSLGYSD
jgi:arylsulfatase A-like enzyme